MKITKILSYDATPAKVLLARAKKIPLTSAQRRELPETVTVDKVTFEIPREIVRPVEVEEVLIDEKGAFYVVEPAEEELLKLDADAETLSQVAVFFLNRGVPVEQSGNSLYVLPLEGLADALAKSGISVEEVSRGFNPIRPPKHQHHGGCCCGHHHHHDGDGCGCGHHHDDGEDGCCCGHHHDDGGDECCCGHHNHDGEEKSCGCGKK